MTLLPEPLAAQITPAPDERVRMTVRLAWGGGPQQRWQGHITLSEGTISLTNLLGMEADEARAIRQQENTIHIRHLTRRNYDGCDFEIDAPAGAMLEVLLAGDEAEQPPRPIRIAIADLVHAPYNVDLDPPGTRILIRRAPGDVIRATVGRGHLVFAPQEILRLPVKGHLTRFPSGGSVQLQAKLRGARGNSRTMWETSRNATADKQGNIDLGDPLEIELPEAEGVYELSLVLAEQRLTNLVFSPRVVHERMIQLVVVDSTKREPLNSSEPQLLSTIDPANPDWWTRLPKLPTYNLWQRSKISELHNQKTSTHEQHKRRWQKLAAGGWHAYPLPTQGEGMPLILEVEYPGDLPQSLGISIIEPDAAGQITPTGTDSGVQVAPLQPGGSADPRWHRIVFWPRSETPLVLFTCRGEEGPSYFGRIRVLSGRPKVETAQRPEERLAVAYMDKPLFARNFGASEALNPTSGRSLQDWITFYQGGERMIEQIRLGGYNAASVAVWCDGGAIYPSRVVRSTPKYDNGQFFDDGRDPVKKDILEMLLRQFDSAGLKFIPALELNTPLQSLEGDADVPSRAESLTLLDHKGRTVLDVLGHVAGEYPYYNPLREEVQIAMEEVIMELAARYGHHESFAGINLRLDSDGYGLLPGPQWGLDAETMEAFVATLSPASRAVYQRVPDEHTARATWILENQLNEWMAWRAERMYRLHSRMAATLQSVKRDTVLYLSTADSFDGAHAQHRLQPELPLKTTVPDILLELGIDRRHYQKDGAVALMQASFVRPEGNPQRKRLYQNFTASIESDAPYSDEVNRAVLHFHVPDTLAVPELDSAKPFGKGGNHTWLATQFSGSGPAVRRPILEHLAFSDDKAVFFGGWMMPLGQEDSLRETLEVFRSIPGQKFETLDLAQAQPLVVRKSNLRGETFVYFANPTPWDLTAIFTVELSKAGTITPLGGSQISRGPQSSGASQWTVLIPPYGLAAAQINVADLRMTVDEIHVPKGVLSNLRNDLSDLAARLRSHREVEPSRLLKNGGFEQRTDEGKLIGWTNGTAPGTRVTAESQKVAEGTQALRLQSEGPVLWVRSDELPVPSSRRVMIRLSLLNDTPGGQQPPVRISVDGSNETRNYYQPVKVGGDSDIPLQSAWSPYVYPVFDLPTDLETFKVGIDLMGPGNILVDKVEVIDVAFREAEIAQLQRLITLADAKYRSGEVGDLYRILNSYWANYLRQHVPVAPALAEQQQQRALQVAEQPKKPEPEKEEPGRRGWFEGIRSRLPRLY